MPATTDCQNWDKCETWERVVAAILATGVKVCSTTSGILVPVLHAVDVDTTQVDLASAAKYYGTTYNTLENRKRSKNYYERAIALNRS